MNLTLSEPQVTAIEVADAYLTDAGLPSYTDVLMQLDGLFRKTSAALDQFDAEVARTRMPLPRGPYPSARWPEGLTHLPAGSPA